MKHDDVWRALDTLAAEHGLSPSGLAKRSGLDATTFNPSKRKAADGRARWPSTESVAKVLDATGASIEAFSALVSGARALPAGGRSNAAAQRRIPLIGRLFSPEQGSGLFAANYELTGSLKDPSVSVNPLSALTPGFLRGFFNLF